MDPATNLKPEFSDDGKLHLSWTAAKGASSYTVDYWTPERYQQVQSISVKGTKATLSELRPATKYTLRVGDRDF